MKPSDFQKTIQCQFECKLKKVTKGIVRNYQKELKRRKNKEIPFWETTVTGTVAQNVSLGCGLEPPGTPIRPPSLSLWSLSYKFQIDYA